jgi:hypothetical protein
MAILPYTATLAGLTTKDIVDVQYWCLQLWPYTHGATWNRGFGVHALMGSGYSCTWSFQFREDLTMFLLTWGHLVESSPSLQKES